MAPRSWSDEELVKFLKMLEEAGSISAAAKIAGVARGTFDARIQLARAKGFAPNTNIKSKHEEEIKTLRRELKKAHEDNDDAESIREQIYGLSMLTPKPPKWLIKPSKGSTSGAPVTLWSDWHYGEVVRKEEVGGANEFNTEIAKARIQRLVETTIDLCFNHMTHPEYPGIVVNLGGDMVSGTIHPEITDTNEKYIQVLMLELQELLIAGLEALADQFGHVFVPCVVGNHGRETLKPRTKGRVYTNYEWNLYCQLEMYFRNDDRVTVMVPSETDAYYSVYGHRFLLTHGDTLGVRGGDGIIGAIGPIMRGAFKMARSETQIGRDFDTIVMGHWHNYLPIPGIVVNGPLKGYDEFARLVLRAPHRPPSQALWFVHPKYGITCHWEVILDGKTRMAKAKKQEWVSILK